MHSFPPTRDSVLAGMQSGDPARRDAALARLAVAYREPVRAYLERWRGVPAEDAEDLTQDFFVRIVAGDVVERYDPARARFRTWLRLNVDGLLAHHREATARLKRGGGAPHVALDDVVAAAPEDPDACFHREWVRSVLGRAIARLDAECAAAGKATQFVVFRRYDVEGPDLTERPSYASLAAELGIPVTQVTNYLAFARRRLRALVLDDLRAVTDGDDELRDEARALLGTDPA